MLLQVSLYSQYNGCKHETANYKNMKLIYTSEWDWGHKCRVGQIGSCQGTTKVYATFIEKTWAS